MVEHTSLTQLLDRAREGDSDAWNQAFEIVYAELRKTAGRVLGRNPSHTLSPTGLVHECYLRLSSDAARKVENRAHFHALAARAMRWVLINRARSRFTAKRGEGAIAIDDSALLEFPAFAAADEHEREALELLALNQALVRLEAEDPKQARVLECRLFAGLSEEETAAALELSLRSTQRSFAAAKLRITELLAG